jgi:adenylosuccinate synthase
VRVADLVSGTRFEALVRAGAEAALAVLRADECQGLEEAIEQTLDLASRARVLATDTGLEIVQGLADGKDILLEGAQGTALDLDHGTYPFVTSSNTTAGGAAIGVGIGPTAIDEVVGVVKAYTTRVGNGPLPTGFEPEMDEKVRALGGEYGATTGRPRRCGWFDAVLARYAARVNGLTALAVTKLDVLDTLSEISVGIEYCSADGSCTREFPANTRMLDDVHPRLETLPGWECDTTGARRLEELPSNARRYLDRIEELTGTPIGLVSVGTRRSQIIHVP